MGNYLKIPFSWRKLKALSLVSAKLKTEHAMQFLVFSYLGIQLISSDCTGRKSLVDQHKEIFLNYSKVSHSL